MDTTTPVTDDRPFAPITEVLRDIDEKVKKINECQDGIVRLRAEELDFIGCNENFTTSTEGHAIIHEGNIKFDLRVIDFLRGLRGLHNWKHAPIGFKLLYNFTAGQLKSIIEEAPEEILETFNFRGTLTRVEVWRRCSEDKKMLLGSCDLIIKGWLDGTAPLSYIQGQYCDMWHQMVERYKTLKGGNGWHS